MQAVTWEEQAEEHQEHQELRHVPQSLCAFSSGQLTPHKHRHAVPLSPKSSRSHDLQRGPDVPDVNHLLASAAQLRGEGATWDRRLL